MGVSWHDFHETESHREANDRYFGAAGLDESDAYEPDDPKNPAYAGGLVDWADSERKREKGE